MKPGCLCFEPPPTLAHDYRMDDTFTAVTEFVLCLCKLIFEESYDYEFLYFTSFSPMSTLPHEPVERRKRLSYTLKIMTGAAMVT